MNSLVKVRNFVWYAFCARLLWFALEVGGSLLMNFWLRMTLVEVSDHFPYIPMSQLFLNLYLNIQF